jgi:hypothetical protein
MKDLRIGCSLFAPLGLFNYLIISKLRKFEEIRIKIENNIDSYREVDVEQSKNQPKTVTYNNIYSI